MNNQGVLEFIIKAKDEATAVLQNVSKQATDMKPAFEKMATAGTVAFGAISAVAIKSVMDFGDAEKSTAQLRHAVISVSKATEEQLQATSDLADALERKGVLDGDNIKMGLAQLSTFGLSNDAVQRLGGSLSDLAVNQFGVSASGEQLSDTANMIAKALNGQFGVLEKSGIRFSEAQKHAIEFGTEMEKVDAINQGFAQNLKYTNDVALTTLEGQTARNAVQLGNMSEALGAGLAPAFRSLLTAVQPIIQSFVEWATEHPKLLAGIIGVTAGLAGLVAIVGFLGLALPAIITGFTLLGGLFGAISLPIIAVGLALGALGTIAYILYTDWQNVIAGFKIMWDEFSSYVQSLWTSMMVGIRNTSGSIWASIVDTTSNYMLAMANWVTQRTLTIKTTFVDTFTAIKTFVIGVFDAIGEKITSWVNTMMSAIQSVIDAVNRAKSAVGGIVSGVTSTITNTASSIFGGKMADGGTAYAGQSYLVGERGAEVFTPNATGVITPAGAGGITINLTDNTFLGDEDLAVKLGNIIAKQIQFNTRI